MKTKNVQYHILGLCLTLILGSCNPQNPSPGKSGANSIEKVNYAALVNTTIGSEGKGVSKTELQFEAGFTFPGAMYPFGMVQFTPTFFVPDQGFVVNQLSGAGCPNMGNFPTLPLSGVLESSPGDMRGLNPSDTIKKAVAGYYRTALNSGVVAELTVTERTGMARFNYPEGDKKGTVVIGSGINANKMNRAQITITGPDSCEGYADGGSFCGAATGYTVYFVAEFDQKAVISGTWEKEKLHEGSTSAAGAHSGAYFTFDVSSGKPVQYKFGISYVSLENARENLHTENPGFDFDKTKSETTQAWNSYLSKIEVFGGTHDQRTQFYTHLYHALGHPSVFNDVNGEYVGSDHKIHKAEGYTYYTALSNWDTYRSQTQLIALLAPEVTSDIITSHLKFAERCGGGLPRWVLADFATGIMQGDPSAALIANAYAFGARDFDSKKALEIMRKGAEVPGIKTQDIITRPFLEQYLNKGYIYDHMGASIALEYTSSDFAIGQFALQTFGDKALYKKYLRRSRNWKKLYNPGTTWLNSRFEDGSWKPRGDDWREATYKNYFWMVPYNLKGLIDTIGGQEIAENRLDSLFVKLNATYYDDWFAAGNEPDFQVPWTYNWTGSPYKTQSIVRKILKESYQNKANGLPGNDDLGAMGAWYVFANLGLYPVIPGVGGFSVNSPVFPEIKVHLGHDKILHITGGADSKSYITSLELNGKDWNNTWISYEDIKNGGELKFNLSEKPDKTWGTTAEPPSFND
ncbi:GH92 family glycosyl hydrolase [Sinomicrobium weinanense]|uniref:Glycoside hydrolase family 92 protein n=1 Tax=Sinomicrobium weinanense TaxID=2842200 RepID=A0A926JSG2_9FLAO|nr:GH92 family glycosyl hydrolase [Sinomicrobium weinanense]MBC9796422.1 glycoside hydrolase family 92 protein [Sinomicrobium weinanense]MBU3125904.1 GH92 family glycosyl hydrolase [Sinomicrobium weinanense]